MAEVPEERPVKQVIVIPGLVGHGINARGMTEFGAVPTRIGLAAGLAYYDRIDPVTGDLELY